MLILLFLIYLIGSSEDEDSPQIHDKVKVQSDLKTVLYPEDLGDLDKGPKRPILEVCITYINLILYR